MRSTLKFPITAIAIVAMYVSLWATAAKPPGPKQRWIDLRTPNFTFYSHLGEGATKQIAANLEELHAVLAKYSSFKLTSPVPTYIYVFRNDRDFTPYKLLYEGRPSATSGYFIRRDNANYIAINGSSNANDWIKGNTRGDATAIVYHEYVHHFAADNLRGIPLWFEEGLAELYSTFRVTGRKIQLGFADPIALSRLNNSKLIPLHDLLAVDHDSPLYNESESKSLFYAQAWAMVHYLLVGSDERRVQAPHFIEMVTAGVPQNEALARAFQADISTLEEELTGYIHRLTFRYLESSANVDFDLPVTVRPMSHADVLYRLGDLFASQESARAEASDYFKATVEIDPEHGLALSALGLLAESRADWDEALSYHLRALALAPDDFTVQYRGGSFLARRGSDLERARAALARAVALAPEYGPAWERLAIAYQTMGDFGPDAIEAAENAHRLVPSNRSLTRSLLRLYITAGDREAAVDLARHGFADNQTDRRRAWSMIVEYDLGQARDLVATGNHQAAEMALDDAQGHVDDATHPESFVTRIQALRTDIQTLRIDGRYKEAVDRYNRGDPDGARQILLELPTQIPDGRQEQAIQSLLELIDHPEKAAQMEARIRTEGGITPEDIQEVNRLVADQDLAGARVYLVSLRSRVHPEEGDWIDAKLAQIDTIVRYNHFVGQFNRAVDQFNEHAYTDAIATLEELLAAQPEGYVADEARELLEDARTALANP